MALNTDYVLGFEKSRTVTRVVATDFARLILVPEIGIISIRVKIHRSIAENFEQISEPRRPVESIFVWTCVGIIFIQSDKIFWNNSSLP